MSAVKDSTSTTRNPAKRARKLLPSRRLERSTIGTSLWTPVQARICNPSPATGFIWADAANIHSSIDHISHIFVYSVGIGNEESERMIRKTRLFTPGPTPLLPAAQFAMAAADIHHRTPEFRALFQKVLAQLKVFVGTKNDVLLLACSGTGAMEASVSNLTSPGDKTVVLTAGKFGERWTGLLKAFGCDPVVVSAPYGQTFDLAAIRKALTPDVKAIFTQATETST